MDARFPKTIARQGLPTTTTSTPLKPEVKTEAKVEVKAPVGTAPTTAADGPGSPADGTFAAFTDTARDARPMPASRGAFSAGGLFDVMFGKKADPDASSLGSLGSLKLTRAGLEISGKETRSFQPSLKDQGFVEAGRDRWVLARPHDDLRNMRFTLGNDAGARIEFELHGRTLSAFTLHAPGGELAQIQAGLEKQGLARRNTHDFVAERINPIRYAAIDAPIESFGRLHVQDNVLFFQPIDDAAAQGLAAQGFVKSPQGWQLPTDEQGHLKSGTFTLGSTGSDTLRIDVPRFGPPLLNVGKMYDGLAADIADALKGQGFLHKGDWFLLELPIR